MGRVAAPRPVQAGDPTQDFDCGEASLNSWLDRLAVRSERDKTARTYVSLDQGSGLIAGYYCLAAHGVERAAIGGGQLARNTPTVVPTILLGRLAVDLRFQGTRLGTSLLHHAVVTSTVAARHIGARALVVDALGEAAAAFYRRHGLIPFPANPLKLFHSLGGP